MICMIGTIGVIGMIGMIGNEIAHRVKHFLFFLLKISFGVIPGILKLLLRWDEVPLRGKKWRMCYRGVCV